MKELDTDRDGTLDFDEFKSSVLDSNKGTKPGGMQWGQGGPGGAQRGYSRVRDPRHRRMRPSFLLSG
jgi:hypothetical protein